jgi:benzoylformate decarboxylase
VLASAHEQSVPIFQQLAGGHPSGRDDVRAIPAVAAQLSAERPVIVVGDEIVKSNAHDEAALLASRLGCPVYQQTVDCGAHFVSDHPCYMGALPRNQQQTSKILGAYDLLIVLGSDPVRMSVHSEHEPLPYGIPIVQIGLVDNDSGEEFPR